MMAPLKCQPVHDRGEEARVGKGFGSAGERLVGSDRNGILLLSLGKGLKEEFGAASIQFHIAKLPAGGQVPRCAAVASGFNILVSGAAQAGKPTSS